MNRSAKWAYRHGPVTLALHEPDCSSRANRRFSRCSRKTQSPELNHVSSNSSDGLRSKSLGKSTSNLRSRPRHSTLAQAEPRHNALQLSEPRTPQESFAGSTHTSL